MPADKEPSGARKMFGDFAPALVDFTDDVLFGQVWPRQELSQKDRSLVTIASLVTSGSTEQLGYHLGLARQNGATETELIEAITHLAFYAGWPKAMSAMTVAKTVFQDLFITTVVFAAVKGDLRMEIVKRPSRARGRGSSRHIPATSGQASGGGHAGMR